MRAWLERHSVTLCVTGVGLVTLALYLLNRSRPQDDQTHTNLPVYTYESFKDAGRSIRLLRVPARERRSASKYELRIFPTESAPPFEAISYTWGFGAFDQVILLQNATSADTGDALTYSALKVSAKVRHILKSREARSGKHDRWVWIDSVCINQEDDAEKSLQVPQMGDIYGRAAKVIICLDDPLDRTPLEFRSVLNLLELWSARAQSTRPTDTLVGSRYVWRKLAQLISHPYWARVWIIQEAALPEHLYIQAEGKLVAWEHFLNIWAAMSRGPGDQKIRSMLLQAGFSVSAMDQFSLNVRQLNDVVQVRQIHHRIISRESPARPAEQELLTDERHLHMLLYDTRRFICKDPRDKVFGLLGLLGTSADLKRKLPTDLLPDYSIATEEVYIRLADWFCSSNLYGSFLLRSGIGHLRKLQDLPSWVVDLTSQPIVYLEETVFSAGGSDDKPAFTCERSQGRVAGLRLTEAYPVGVLSQILAQPLDMMNTHPTKFILAADALAERSFRDQADSAVQSQPLRDSLSREEMLWRTLIMDMDMDKYAGRFSSPAPAALGKDFALCLQNAKLTSSASPLVRDPHSQASTDRILELLSNSHGRNFGITESLGMAMVPPLSQAGDELFVIKGLRVPVLLRSVEHRTQEKEPPSYRLVGDAYCHGFMKGEALRKNSFEIVLV